MGNGSTFKFHRYPTINHIMQNRTKYFAQLQDMNKISPFVDFLKDEYEMNFNSISEDLEKLIDHATLVLSGYEDPTPVHNLITLNIRLKTALKKCGF